MSFDSLAILRSRAPWRTALVAVLAGAFWTTAGCGSIEAPTLFNDVSETSVALADAGPQDAPSDTSVPDDSARAPDDSSGPDSLPDTAPDSPTDLPADSPTDLPADSPTDLPADNISAPDDAPSDGGDDDGTMDTVADTTSDVDAGPPQDAATETATVAPPSTWVPTCSDCSHRFWREIARARPATPRGHLIAVGCHDCAQGGTAAAAAAQVDAALAESADLIEVNAVLSGDTWTLADATGAPTDVPLANALSESTLASSDALVGILVWETSVSSMDAASLSDLLAPYASVTRPVLIRTTTERRGVLLTLRASLSGPTRDAFRLVEIYRNTPSTPAPTIQIALERTASDGFEAAEFDLNDRDLFGKLTYARKLGLAVGARYLPEVDGPVQLASFREELDYVWSSLGIAKARAVVTEDNALTYVNTFDLKPSELKLPFTTDGAARRFADLRHPDGPAVLRWNIGEDLYGGLLDFTPGATSEEGQFVELAPVAVPAGQGFLVTVVANLDNFGVDTMEPGTTRVLVANTQLGGFSLNVRRPSDGTDPLLRFSVYTGGDPAGYITATRGLGDIKGGSSYVITGAYDRDANAVRLWVNMDESESTPGSTSGDVVNSPLPVIIGADPQPTTTRYHADAKIQMVSVLGWGRHGCQADSDCAQTSCGAPSCDTATGMCETTAPTGQCLLKNTCYDSDATHPTDECLVCQGSTGEWGPSPTAGALCQLAQGEPLDVIVQTRTDDGAFSGTPQLVEVCFSSDLCLPLNNFPASYQGGSNTYDLASAAVDHFRFRDIPAGAIKQVVVRHAAADDDPTTLQNGSNAWAPQCLSLIVNGELVFCRDDYQAGADTLWIGTDPADTAELSSDDPTLLSCGGCYPAALSHGPMVGRVTPATALLWFRTEYARDVQVRYSTSPTFEGPTTATTDSVETRPEEDFVKEVLLSGLPSGATIYYQVLVDAEVASPPGLSFRTAPDGPANFTVGLASCGRFSVDPTFAAYQALASHGPDLMLMLGDNNYANISTYAGLAHHYMRDREVPALAQLMATTPHLATWDDHDFGPNNANGQLAIDKVEAAAAFRRFWANGQYGSDGADGIWSNHRFGDVEFFMLDGRYHRQDFTLNPDGSMLGGAQLAWLFDRLASSTASFKVLVSGSRWTFNSSPTDSWHAHPSERNAILEYIKLLAIPGVFFVSGDIHRSVVTDLTKNGAGDPVPQSGLEGTPSAYPLFEVTSSGAASASSSCGDPTANDEVLCVEHPQQYALMHFDMTAATGPSVQVEFYVTDQPDPAETFTLELSTLTP